MTVKELIVLLAGMPVEAPVVVRGYEGGLSDVRFEDVNTVDIKLNHYERDVEELGWYQGEIYGAHLEVDKDGDETAVLIDRDHWQQ